MSICPSCGQENPGNFRFCGSCGARMQTDAPESAMDRLIRSVENGKQKAAEHKHPEAERRMNDRRSTIEAGEAAKGGRERNSSHWAIERDPRPAPSPPALNAGEKRPSASPPPPQAPKAPAAPPRPEKPAFIYDPKPSELVSGPSFLGLGGDSTADTSYLFEEEEPKRSHARAYLLLLFLIAVGVLAALQYRTLKAQGFTFPWSKISGSQQQQQQPPAQAGQAQPQQNPGAQAPMPQSDGGDFPQAQQTNSGPNSPSGAQPGNNAGGEVNGAAPAKGNGPDMTAAPPTTTAPANHGATPASDNSDPKASSKPEDKPAPAVGRNKTSASEPARDEEQDQEQSSQQPEQPKKAARVRTSVAAPLPSDPKALWKASSAGNSDASVKLAEMYLNGDRVERSCDQAVVLLHDAADAGNSNAEIKLGALYASGTCLPLDNVSAYRWFTRALKSQPHNGYLDYSRRMVWGRMNDQERQQVAALNGIPQ